VRYWLIADGRIFGILFAESSEAAERLALRRWPLLECCDSVSIELAGRGSVCRSLRWEGLALAGRV
jgi:hypothetical protein